MLGIYKFRLLDGTQEAVVAGDYGEAFAAWHLRQLQAGVVDPEAKIVLIAKVYDLAKVHVADDTENEMRLMLAEQSPQESKPW